MTTPLHRHVIAALDAIAPPSGAESWDNTGVLVGRRDAPAGLTLLTIDLTDAVLREAIERGATLVIAYHPPIFDPLTAVTDETPKARLVLEAIEAGITICAPHTALDAAPGGVNDWLAEGFGPGTVTALVPATDVPASETHKLVTFCPRDAVDSLRAALSAAGAGRIGAYTSCSFELDGHGTFEGDATTTPAVGQAGTRERVAETRLEMVCSRGALGAAIAAVRAAHPYEEPAFEIHELAPRPDLTRGAGRFIELDAPVAASALAKRLVAHLGIPEARLALATPDATVARAACCAGAGGSLLSSALARGGKLFLTGEMRHHDALAALAAGCSVIVTGHTNTERGYLPRLRDRLAAACPDIEFVVSERDRFPFQTVR